MIDSFKLNPNYIPKFKPGDQVEIHTGYGVMIKTISNVLYTTHIKNVPCYVCEEDPAFYMYCEDVDSCLRRVI